MIGSSGQVNSERRFRFKGVLITCDPTSPDLPMTRSPDSSLVSHDLQPRSRRCDSYDFFLVVHINNNAAVLSIKPEAAAFHVFALHRNLFLAFEVDSNNFGCVLSRYKHAKLLGSRIAAQSFWLRSAS